MSHSSLTRDKYDFNNLVDWEKRITLLLLFSRLLDPESFTKQEVKILHEGIFR